MSDTRFVINLDIKGKAELDRILQQIGIERKMPVDVDLSKAKLGIVKDLNQPLKEAVEGFRSFTTHAGFVISGTRQIYGVLQSTIGRVVGAAAEAQNAQIGLSGALRATGLEVDQNTKRLLDYASGLQKLTVYDDEMLAGSMAQMQNIARFTDVSSLEKATKAAIGLSAAFGIDLATAMDLVGKAAAGNTSMLGRYGIVLDEGASQADKFNQVLSRGLQFFPIAEQYANSQIGSMQQLKNAWGDFLETLGEGVLPVIKSLTDVLKPLVETASAMSGEQKALTVGLIVINALVVKHTLVIMAQRAAFAALTIEQQKQVGSLMMLIAMQKGGSIGTLSFSGAMRGLGTSLAVAGASVKAFFASLGPVGWTIMGITAAVGTLTAVLGAKSKADKEHIENQKKLIQKGQESIETKKSEANRTLELTERYTALSRQKNRSVSESKEMASIYDQIKSKYPSLISSTENMGNALELMGRAAVSAKKDLQDLARQSIDLARTQARVNVMETRRAALDAKSDVFSWAVDIGAAVTAVFGSSVGDLQASLNALGKALNKDDVSGVQYWINTIDQNSGAFTRNEADRWALLKLAVNDYVQALKDAKDVNSSAFSSVSSGQSSGSRSGGASGSGETSDYNKEEVERRLAEYKQMLAVKFIAEDYEISAVKERYLEEIRAASDNAERLKELTDLQNYEIGQIQKKYAKEREDSTKAHYDTLKFADSSYYEWKKEQIRLESWRLFQADNADRQNWEKAQIASLDTEKNTWDNRPLAEFEASYDKDMSHLSELRELGLATYAEIAEMSWNYYHALEAIVSADGDVSEAEDKLLKVYKARAQAAQLAANGGSDLTSYYNEMMFADQNYYDWKKGRIQEEIKQMDLSEEQKAELLKKRLGELDSEQHQDNQDRSLIGFMLEDLGVSESDQKGIIESYSILAGQISSIWKQLYSNLESARQDSLEKLEKRAKDERRTEAWLASEKAKINADYDKKARQLKKAEKAMQIASASMNTAEAVTNALTLKPAWLAPIMAAAVGALGLYQVSLIANQKLARGGMVNPGIFRGKGTSTSDSNLVAISDNEYIVSARRVRELGLPLFDALNFGNTDAVRSALAGLSYRLNRYEMTALTTPASRSMGFSSGGYISAGQNDSPRVQKVVLVCDGRELARAVAKGNKRILST